MLTSAFITEGINVSAELTYGPAMLIIASKKKNQPIVINSRATNAGLKVKNTTHASVFVLQISS